MKLAVMLSDGVVGASASPPSPKSALSLLLLLLLVGTVTLVINSQLNGVASCKIMMDSMVCRETISISARVVFVEALT